MNVYNITNHYYNSDESRVRHNPTASTPRRAGLRYGGDSNTSVSSKARVSEPSSSAAGRPQTGDNASPLQAEASPWQLKGDYDPERLISSRPAAIIAIKEREESKLAIRLSPELATSLERALQFAGTWLKTYLAGQERHERAKILEVDHTEAVARIERRLTNLRREGQVEDEDQAEYRDLESHRRRALEARNSAQGTIRLIEGQWSSNDFEMKARWQDVEKLLKQVWADAHMPLRKIARALPRQRTRSSSRRNQDNREEMAGRVSQREGGKERLERRNDRPSAPRAETKTPFDKRKLVDPHSEVLSAIARLSRRHKDLIRARDRCENYCHNYDREGARYLKAVQNSNGSRSSNSIREEFNKVFLRDVILDKKSLQVARTDYLAAHEEARKLGIPKNCIDFVESIDLQSCDTGIIMEKDAVNRRATGDDQHKLDSCVRAWRTLTTADPLPQQVIAEDSPDRLRSASSAGRTESSVDTDASRGLSRGDAGKRTRATRKRLQGQRSDAGTESSVVQGIGTGVDAEKEHKTDLKHDPALEDSRDGGPEVNLWKPSDGIKFSRSPEKVLDANDNKDTVKPNPPVRVSPRGGKKSIAYFFKARPKTSKSIVGPGKAADTSIAGEAMSGEKRKSSSEGSPSSNKRRRSERPTAPD